MTKCPDKMRIDELIAIAIPILPTDCRLKRAQKEYERSKMKQQAEQQYASGKDVLVVFGKYKLQINYDDYPK